jgi:carboxyl-terminal processing protease
VVDMRKNGGGLLDDARVMTGLFIDLGPVVQTQVTDGDREVLGDSDPGTSYDGAVVVLVDRFSASASEIVAGALQDYNRAVVVGTGPTHGKGTVQVLADLDRFGGGEPLGDLKLTVQQFFRVSGASTQWQGVVPDIKLPDPEGHIESGERHLDDSIPWSQIDPVAYTAWPTSWKLADLSARSQERQSKNDVFGKIARRTELLVARRENSKVPLARDAWLAHRDKQRAALEAVSPRHDEGPVRLTVTTVDYGGKTAHGERPGGKGGKAGGSRTDRWRENLARDPFVEEAVLVLRDMVATAEAGAAR